MARAAMARIGFSLKDVDAARYGLPPLPPALLIRELPAADDAIDEAGGPGWYQSSRELRRGLEVQHLAIDEWLAASFFGGITPRQAAA